jgi:hypothetical protein
LEQGVKMTWNNSAKMMAPIVFGAALFAWGCNKNGPKSSIEAEKPTAPGPVEVEEKAADEGYRSFGGSSPENSNDAPRREEPDQEEEIEDTDEEEEPIEEDKENEDEVVEGYELWAGTEVI